MEHSCQGKYVSFASFPAFSNTFNPLVKDFFIFPWWHLFAIGAKHMFSCRWNLPPVLRSSPKERDSRKSTVHNDMHMTHGTFTLLEILFQEAFTCTVVGHSSPKNNSRLRAPIPMLCLSMFIRHYSWNPIWFLILHLLICLNSVGEPTWCHILMQHRTKMQEHAWLQHLPHLQLRKTHYKSDYLTCLLKHINDKLALMCTILTRHSMWMNNILMNPEANLLARISQKHRIHSKTYWFTETCNSQCLLHFAAPFMVIWAETSVAENIVLMWSS